MSVSGEELVDILTERGVPLDPATKCQWRARQDVSKTILKNAFRRSEERARENLITPIVEFHELNFKHGNGQDTFLKRIDDKSVSGSLKKWPGIYGFFEGRGELVYVGKTERNHLFAEMDQRYKGKKIEFRVMKGAKSVPERLYIKDIAVYFSAYYVHQDLIRDVEALLTRLMINGTTNLQIAKFRSELKKK